MKRLNMFHPQCVLGLFSHLINVFMCKTHSRFPSLPLWSSSHDPLTFCWPPSSPPASWILPLQLSSVAQLLCLYSLFAVGWRAYSALMSCAKSRSSACNFMSCLEGPMRLYLFQHAVLVLDASGEDDSARVLWLLDGGGGVSCGEVICLLEWS